MSEKKDLYNEIIIKSIRELSFSINDEFYIEDPSRVIKIELYQSTGINEENKMVKLVLGIYLHYDNSDKRLIESKVSNEFFIPNLLKYRREKGIALPSAFIYLMVNESIAHSRALLAKNVAGTPFEQIPIPIGDPIAIATQFFPGLIKLEEREVVAK